MAIINLNSYSAELIYVEIDKKKKVNGTDYTEHHAIFLLKNPSLKRVFIKQDISFKK